MERYDRERQCDNTGGTMHRFKLLGLACLAVFAFAIVSAGAAMATEPLLLVLTGEKVSELKYEGTGGTSKLATLKGKTITCTATKAKATFAAVAGKEADSSTGEATLDFEGCKKEAVACRSEKAGTKDPVETILTVTGLTGASEETSAKVLQFILVNTLKEPLVLVCGVVKEEIKGSVACLVTPALTEIAAGGAVAIACKINASNDQETGKCVETKATCEALTKAPLEANLGAGFEDAAEEISVSGTFNKMVTLDD